MIELPTIFIYLISFYWLTLQKEKYRFIHEDNLHINLNNQENTSEIETSRAIK